MSAILKVMVNQTSLLKEKEEEVILSLQPRKFFLTLGIIMVILSLEDV